MAESGEWKVLKAGGESGGVVLAVDFDTTGRPEARFSDLAANLATDLAVWETVPPVHGTAPTGSGAGYVDYWSGPIESEKPLVKAVMGFCAGSVYAAALTERISRFQEHAPQLLVFDPEISVPQTLMWQYHKVVGFMSSVISAEDVAAARAAGQRVHDETMQRVVARASQIRELKDGLIRLIREIGEPAFAGVGLDRTRREELFSVFESFLCYLAAASEIDPFTQWRSATAFSSASPLSGLRAMRASGVAGSESLSVAREYEIDVEHGVLLADKDLAGLVADVLGA
ncbi:hypothetical protein [Streptomyces odontomachi]|uniref:hypothetical protein n=1 Tax=Streptomyces odontomachi TaxID=2944940 RepID=UPI00210E28B0|nr:hypothetical protein [Streptomyces sp. ODS25]